MSEEKTLIFIPEEDVTVNFAVTEDKPFNQCFECSSFRNGCSGPNLAVMGVKRACEFLQMARVFQDLSYQDVADATGISLTTVKRTLTGKVNDPGFYSMSAISVFLLGDPAGKYPCAIPATGAISVSNAVEQQLREAAIELERAMADKQDYRAALDNIHVSYSVEIQAIRTEANTEIQRVRAEAETEKQRIRDESQKKIDFLMDHTAYLRAENDRKSKIIDRYLGNIMNDAPKEA